MNQTRGTSDDVEELIATTVDQIIRYLRFDGAVLYWHASDLNVLWPLMQRGHLRGRPTPVIPGLEFVGAVFRSGVPIIADGSALPADAWLRAESAATVVTIPLSLAAEASGSLVLFSRRSIVLDPGAMQGVRILAARITATIRRAPFLVTANIQHRQIEVLTGIIADAAGDTIADAMTIYERIADVARLLSGAHAVAFARAADLCTFRYQPARAFPRCFRVRTSKRGIPAHPRTQRTILRHALSSHGLTLSLLWRCVFRPTKQQEQLIASIAHTLAALDSLRLRLMLAERERRAQYVADVQKVLSISLEPSTVLEHLQSLFVPAIADWVIVETDSHVPRARASVAVHQGAGTAQSGDAGPAEVVTAPMFAGERSIGSVSFGRSFERGRASADDLALYESLAALAAAAIANALSFDRERDIADILQHALLPSELPRDRRVLFDSVYVPALARTSIGGDWYDAFALDEDRYAVSIGDVVGHGIQAAATMNLVRLTFRAAALGGMDLTRILECAERVLLQEAAPTMATAIFGIVNLRESVFSYVCAGHVSPLVVRADGSVIDTSPTLAQPPLGIGFASTGEPTNSAVALRPGDTLVLYTDGMIEYGRDCLAGEQRLRGLLPELVDREPRRRLARNLHAAIFCDGVVQHDDVAVLTVSIPAKARAVRWSMPAVPSSAPVLRGKLRDFLAESPCDEIARFDILTAAGEAIANSLEHAYGDDTGLVSVRASYGAQDVCVEVSDRGTYKIREPSPDRGFGTTLMKAFANDVRVTGNDEGTTVRLRFS